MIRHIFMATAKEGTPDEVINRKMDEMRAMKDSVPAIQAITVARNLGWAGPANVVTMIVDVKDKAGFDALLARNWRSTRRDSRRSVPIIS